jgi:hypothetical protein
VPEEKVAIHQHLQSNVTEKYSCANSPFFSLLDHENFALVCPGSGRDIAVPWQCVFNDKLHGFLAFFATPQACSKLPKIKASVTVQVRATTKTKKKAHCAPCLTFESQKSLVDEKKTCSEA